MKHNTHIYLATKSIELLYEGVRNIKNIDGTDISPKAKRDLLNSAKTLQRFLLNYRDSIKEASWAPDDILNDKVMYHTFKLFTDKEFPNSKSFAKEIHQEIYYRASGGGGLPYKVDHLARVISDMNKLRNYNDRFSMNQIMYYFFLLSHYVVDAFVPMHCDLRDDPPSDDDLKKPRNGTYFSERLHGDLEDLWEDAVTPIAISEGIIEKQRCDDNKKYNYLSEKTLYDVTKEEDIDEIKPKVIEKDLMAFMINICIESKKSSLRLFPIENPENYSKDVLIEETRKIFSECISNIISIWIWIWSKK